MPTFVNYDREHMAAVAALTLTLPLPLPLPLILTLILTLIPTPNPNPGPSPNPTPNQAAVAGFAKAIPPHGAGYDFVNSGAMETRFQQVTWLRVRVGLGLGLGLGWLQPRSHKIAASTTQGCSLSCLGCSLRHVRLQVTWHQASRRVRWRWNTEAIFHDLDGTFTQH